MRISSKGRLAIGIVGLVAVAGLVVWWATQQGQLPNVPTSITQPKPTTNVAATAAKTNAEAPKVIATSIGSDANDPNSTDETPEKPQQKTWEDHLDDILLSDDDNNAKTDQILALLQMTPADHQEEVAQHLVNLGQDDHYDGISNLLLNVSTSTNVADVLMNDLLNRNNSLKLNTLLAVLKTPDHPMHDNAKEMLELFVQEDHGTNYEAWDKAVADWLKDNEPPPQAQAQAADPNAPAPQ